MVKSKEELVVGNTYKIHKPNNYVIQEACWWDDTGMEYLDKTTFLFQEDQMLPYQGSEILDPSESWMLDITWLEDVTGVIELAKEGTHVTSFSERYETQIPEVTSEPPMPECKPSKNTENQWSDKHYDFKYKLKPEDIEKGFIKIDPYLVNRIWRINAWDDTGAAFHSLKNYARISNGKNPLERDLTSLYKQVKVLCKLHGVNLDD